MAVEDTKCRGLNGGCRTSWGLDLEALARGTIWVIEEGVNESGMGCSGKEGPSHKSGVALWIVPQRHPLPGCPFIWQHESPHALCSNSGNSVSG